jgi:antitoxin component of RelBE/YafQ-DinJ toxin-antitoxin module
MMAKKKYISLRMSDREINAVNALAKNYGVSRSELIRTLLTREIVDQVHLIEFMSNKSTSNVMRDAVDVFRVKLENAHER